MICAIISDKSELCSVCKNEYENPFALIKDNLTELIWEYHRKGATEFYINCEYGIPLWAGETICSMKKHLDITLSIILPCEEQCRNWSEEQRDRYYAVNRQCDYASMVRCAEAEEGCELAEKMMIDSADTVIIYAKSPESTHAYRYALENEKNIVTPELDLP